MNYGEMDIDTPGDDNDEQQQYEPAASQFQEVAETFADNSRLFDWRSLVDLHSVGQTWKCMQQLAGGFFRLNYAGANDLCKKGDVFIGDVRISGFCEIESIVFCDDDWHSFQFAKDHEFKSLKRIKSRVITFTAEMIASILNILAKAEAVKVYDCSIYGEFYKKFLQHCPNIIRFVLEPVLNSIQ